MPKECTHWYLAQRVRKSLPLRLAEVINRFPHLFLIGAIAPDIPFYSKNQRNSARFRQRAQALHGDEGADSLSPFKACSRVHGDTLPDDLTAFLCGYLTHVAADCCFHPLVLHLAAGCKYIHHAIETIMDLYFLRFSTPPHGRLSRTLLRRLETDQSRFLSILELTLFDGDEYSRKDLASCLNEYVFTQRLFWSRFAAFLIRCFAGRHAELADSVSSYYQPRFIAFCRAFDEPIAYLHPVTGEPFQESAQGIADRTVERALSLINDTFQKHGQKGWRLFIESQRGPNLITGLEYGSPATIVHCSAEKTQALFPGLSLI